MNAIVKQENGALVAAQSPGRMAVADIISHVATVQEVMRAVMKPDVHFGVIPGTDKPTLLKPGAELLCMTFRISDSYQVEDLSSDGVVRYRVTCTGTHQTTGVVLGTGMGEASSGEEKYKWRKAYKDEFEATPPNLRREKKGYDKTKKQPYSIMQVRTEPADLANTVLKMANKRAKMAMVLNVTAASDCFSQDLEDMDEALREHLARRGEDHPAQPEPQQPPVWPDDKFDAQFSRWSQAIQKGLKTHDDIINLARTKGELTPAQEKRIKDIQPPTDATPKAEATDAGPVVTYAEVAEALHKANDPQKLSEAADLIGAVANEKQRAELSTIYHQRREAIGLVD